MAQMLLPAPCSHDWHENNLAIRLWEIILYLLEVLDEIVII